MDPAQGSFHLSGDEGLALISPLPRGEGLQSLQRKMTLSSFLGALALNRKRRPLSTSSPWTQRYSWKAAPLRSSTTLISIGTGNRPSCRVRARHRLPRARRRVRANARAPRRCAVPAPRRRRNAYPRSVSRPHAGPRRPPRPRAPRRCASTSERSGASPSPTMGSVPAGGEILRQESARLERHRIHPAMGHRNPSVFSERNRAPSSPPSSCRSMRSPRRAPTTGGPSWNAHGRGSRVPAVA